ncbi:hypothetical protein Q428_09045 [Fervidicella metallireducens AeB]|uniref:Preprotein translocase SecA n=1 Tax=Fervidicella metallireducens AeB TaxID=1403537 RepID=A0A017RTY7_9CLOT|nr:SEC-C metal-binding domain-containing protein [Fervidicella metallireducens]EYE88233.1 hypothetical protein Q428_09045 [Fervidicella metallireducens AeB]
MSLYDKWLDLVNIERDQEEYDEFWEGYFVAEEKVYQKILGDKLEVVSGKVSELAEGFKMDLVTFAGFLSGINTSLKQEIDLDSITEESEIKLEIDFEKLYFNMLDAQADWLYTLKEWDDILTVEKRKEIKKQYNATKTIVKEDKTGRNEPCPCGSGKKYKKCCGK